MDMQLLRIFLIVIKIYHEDSLQWQSFGKPNEYWTNWHEFFVWTNSNILRKLNANSIRDLFMPLFITYSGYVVKEDNGIYKLNNLTIGTWRFEVQTFNDGRIGYNIYVYDFTIPNHTGFLTVSFMTDPSKEISIAEL